MVSQAARRQAVGRLQQAIEVSAHDKEYQEMVDAKQEVLARFGPLFTPERIASLPEKEFRDFLYYEHNKHWTGLYRQVNRLCEDMDALRDALAALLDEGRPLAQRFGEAIASVHGLGKATASAILTVAYPDRYGVWNNTSEQALRQLRVWPDFGHGTSRGRRYEIVNDLLSRLRDALETDFWTLDALFWRLLEEQEEEPAARGSKKRFALERHLHDFMTDNWNDIALSDEWDIYTEEGELVGYEYPTDVGYIDILARHKLEPRWLVIELKRAQTSDQTVGQVLRYMGWIRRHLPEGRDGDVQGLVIAHRTDPRLLAALSVVEDVQLQLYEVDFRLKPVPGEVL